MYQSRKLVSFFYIEFYSFKFIYLVTYFRWALGQPDIDPHTQCDWAEREGWSLSLRRAQK